MNQVMRHTSRAQQPPWYYSGAVGRPSGVKQCC